MINSRRIEDLHPVVQRMCKEFLVDCAGEGIDILITSTYRDFESQARLYAQGRMTPGKIVTNAKAGYSFHNYRVAFDVVPIRNGKLVWGTKGDDLKLWKLIGDIGKAVGLEWAGDWKGRIKEYAHLQFSDGHDINYFLQGGSISDNP